MSRLSNLTLVLVLLVFGLLSAIGVANHEIWLDEAHHWLLARDSTSLTQLVHNARYDGHPLLWNLLLFFITLFSSNPIGMQVLHVGIAATTAWLVLRYAPFPRIWKVLFVFGYFPFYEYNLIARSYAPGMLLLFTACVLYRNRAQHYPLLGLVLALLSNIHVLFLVLAFVLGLAVGTDFLRNGNASRRSNFMIGLVVFAVGAVLSALQIILLSHHFHRFSADPRLNLQWLGKDLLMIEQAFIPVPNLTDGHFWNSNLLISLVKPLAAVVSVLLWLIPMALFFRKRRSLWLFYGGALGVVAVLHLAQHSALHYFGLLYAWLVATQWIAAGEPTEPVWQKLPIQRWLAGLDPVFGRSFWYTIGVVQLLAGLIAYSFDLARPFSEGKAAVNYLNEHQLNDRLIAVSFFNAGPPVSAYLGKKVYYPEIDTLGSFCIWNTTPFFISQDTLLARIRRQAQKQDIILLLNHPLDSPGQPVLKGALYPDAGVRMNLLTQFDKSIMRNENYYLYQVNLLR